MKHPELERLRKNFRWHPESVAHWNPDLNNWVGRQNVLEPSVYSDSAWESVDDVLDESWWYTTRNAIILSALQSAGITSSVWDVGCGTGVVSRFLSKNNFVAVGIEPSHAGAAASARRGVLCFQASLEQLALPESSVNNLSMFDVLEHLDNRARTLKEIHRLLNQGGHLVLTVPALTWLWSQFDTEAGHYLRYSKRSIRRELESHGFDIVRSGYFFALTVPPLFVLRALPFRLGRRNSLATEATLGATGGRLGKLLAAIEKILAFRTPFGSSLLVIARKR